MSRLDWSGRVHFLVATACVLVCWNYWLPTFLVTFCPSSATYYGYNSADFNIFYTAGANWLAHTNPYLSTYPGLFVYPPSLLPLYGAFALFRPDTAALLWMGTYFAVFAATSFLAALTLQGERRALFASILPLLFFTSFPLLIMMELGQSDLLVASLSILSLVLLRMNRKHLSPLFLSIAVLMKGAPVFLLIYFVLYRRDFRYLINFLIFTLLIVGLSALVVPLSWYSYFLTDVVPSLSVVQTEPMNQSIIRYVAMVGLGDASSLVSIAGAAIFSFFSFVIGRRLSTLRNEPLQNDSFFLLNVLVMLLLGPRSWPATYVWVIIPLALFLSSILTENVRLVYLAFLGLGTILLSSTLVQFFLVQAISQMNHLQLTELPLLIIGNTIMVVSVTLLLVRINAVKIVDARSR